MKICIRLVAVLMVWTGVLAAPRAGGPPGEAAQAELVTVVLETDKGVIEIVVDTKRAPVTSENFLKYVDGGYYDGGRFHRTVRPETENNRQTPIEVIQASPAAGNRPGLPAIPLEPTTMTGLRHEDGTVSMARMAGRPDSATSDFFICIGDQPSLDFGGARNADGQGFAAFGRVVGGMDVVKAIQASSVRPGTQRLDPPITIKRAYRKQAGG